MSDIQLTGCTATPFGAYLKALGVFRLVSEQADAEVRLWWDGDTPILRSTLDEESLLDFFLSTYRPTPILAPWNRGSGFYDADVDDVGVNAIARSADARFAEYAQAIRSVRDLPVVKLGKPDEGDVERRTAIALACRNTLSDRVVDWIDAVAGTSADGKRYLPPILGTGGNEGNFDYTDNFMQRLAEIFVSQSFGVNVSALLAGSLFASPQLGLQVAAAGQFDPGRAGGANQGAGVKVNKYLTNPWDLVLTLEGTVAWASGIYRRQGVSYKSFLCSPFTVRAASVGYASASKSDEARAEVWVPLWTRPASFPEIKMLLREGRSNVDGHAAQTGLQFAEAVSSLGVDRGIGKFVRYNLLKRRGDSYVALPVGVVTVCYRSTTDRVRELLSLLERIDNQGPLPSGCEDLRRNVERSAYQALLRDTPTELRSALAAVGRLVRRLTTISGRQFPNCALDPQQWIAACDDSRAEVRIAAALASILDPDLAQPAQKLSGSINHQLVSGSKIFSWQGRDLPSRMVSLLDRRLKLASSSREKANPGKGFYALDPADSTIFLDHQLDDDLIEDLFFAFCTMRWSATIRSNSPRGEILPLYAILKYSFLPGSLKKPSGESVTILADPSILTLLRSGDVSRAAKIAIHRLKVAGLRPLDVDYLEADNPERLAAALLIPIFPTARLGQSVLHRDESN
ncbi:MAG: type I-U CRISPR-associated protein Csx17 [Bryobacteraceae bacterium]